MTLRELYDALDEGLHAEALAHVEDGRDYDGIAALVAEVLHEAHVELDEVEIELFEQVERGVLTAKVVHPHGETALVEALDLALQEALVLGKGALGDLERQEVGL